MPYTLGRGILLHFAAGVALLLLLGIGMARGHAFFSQACCSGRDCSPAGVGMVTWTASGWFVQRTGEIVAFADPRIQYVPPEEVQQFYICLLPQAKRIRCIYVPESGG